MAMFMKLGPVQAQDIDSEAATDGQVLTADGAGKAAWEDAGGGGASFAFDGATIVLGDLKGIGYPATVTLTLGGAPITGKAAYFAFFTGSPVPYPAMFMTTTDNSARGMQANADGDCTGFLVLYDSGGTPEIALISLGEPEAWFNILLPTGGLVTSAKMTFEEAPPP